MARFDIGGDEGVRGILGEACTNRELLILATARGRYESHFLQLDSDSMHIAPTMGPETILYELRDELLSVRFPSGTRFLEGKTRLLGHGMVDGKRSLRMSVPPGLQDDELRRGHRVSRVGKVEVSFHTKRYDLRVGLLMDISTGGVRINAIGANLEDDLALKDRIALSLTLEAGPRLDAKGVVRWLSGRNVGLEFDPPLDRKVLAELARWVFLRREEDIKQADADAAARRAAVTGERLREIFLISSSVELEEPVSTALEGLGPLVRVPGTLQGLKEAMARNPALILLHTKGTGLDDRRRLKGMAELLGGRIPTVLLGTDLESAQLFQLGNDLKVTQVFGFRPSVASFFKRLVGGLIRRSDKPEASAEG